MRNAIIAHATRNDTIKPTARTCHSVPVNDAPCLSREYPDAATMVGIARKNENSTAVARDAPNSMAPIIVAAERDVPGIIARHWIKPMAIAVL